MLLTELNNRFNTKILETINDPYDNVIPNYFIFQILIFILKSYSPTSDIYNNIIGKTPIQTSDNLNYMIHILKVLNRDLSESVPTKLFFWFIDRIHESQLNQTYKNYFETITDGRIEFFDNNILASKVNNLLRRIIARYDIKFHEFSIMTKTVTGCVSRFNLMPIQKFTRLTERPFRKANGSSVKVSYMYQNGICGYFNNNKYTILSFILQNQYLSFNVLTGGIVTNLGDFIKMYMGKETIRPVSLIMPEIDVYSVLDLNNVFKGMGLDEMFKTFEHKNMFSGNVNLSQILCHTQVILKGNHNAIKVAYPEALEITLCSTFQYFVLHIPSNVIILSGVM